MASNRDIDLLLIGKTGNGKSATGNSILRKTKCFKAIPTTQSVTTEIQFEYSQFGDRVIKVVDGPGVGDTRMSDEEALELVQSRLQQAVKTNPDGYHAFLLVVRYGGRFTKEDLQTINSLKHIFGMDFVKHYCILVMTCGDVLEGDMDEYEMTFDQWLQAQEGVFKELVIECNRRVIIFNNKIKDEAQKTDQVTKLVKLIDSLGGRRYTDKHFEKARRLREKLIIEAKEPRIREETLKQSAILMQKLEEIQLVEPDDQIQRLQKIMVPAKELQQNIQDQDKETGALKYSLEAADSIVTQIKRQSEHCKKVINDRQRAKKEQEQFQKEFDAKLKSQNEEYERRMKEEREQEEQRRQEEKEEMAAIWEQEKREEAARQQERLEALKKELENRSEQERLQREKEFNEKIQQEAKQAEKKRKREQKELEEKLRRELQAAETRRKKEAEELKKKQKEEEKKREEEYKRREEKRERERCEEKERYERELQRERERGRAAYEQSKKSESGCTIL